MLILKVVNKKTIIDAKYNESVLQILTKQFGECIYEFHYRFEFISKGQIPNFAFVLLAGQVVLINDRKMKFLLDRGSVFGLNELKKNLPSSWDCIVEKNTQLLMVEKKISTSLIPPYS